MNRVSIEHAVPDQRETPRGVLLRLWEELEQLSVAAPAASLAPARPHPSAVPTRRQEAADALPTRVLYAFD